MESSDIFEHMLLVKYATDNFNLRPQSIHEERQFSPFQHIHQWYLTSHYVANDILPIFNELHFDSQRPQKNAVSRRCPKINSGRYHDRKELR